MKAGNPPRPCCKLCRWFCLWPTLRDCPLPSRSIRSNPAESCREVPRLSARIDIAKRPNLRRTPQSSVQPRLTALGRAAQLKTLDSPHKTTPGHTEMTPSYAYHHCDL